MAELLGFASQSCLLLPTPSEFRFRTHATPSGYIRRRTLQPSNERGCRQRPVVSSFNQKLDLKPIVAVRAVSESQSSSIITDNVDLAAEGIEVVPNTGDDGYDALGGGGGGGGGGSGGGSGGGGSDRRNEGGGDSEGKKKMALSMSQKLTLGYAALIGMGGIMGYMKSGSQKSLLAGGVSASLLYYVYLQLPTNPVFASSIGLGVAAVLTGVMGSRFMKSKKVFPAGVVSLVSLVMTGGYLHGIMRSAH